jgi:rhodanese-related sulfurtransferase
MALMLRDMGLRDAYAIIGGYPAWQARNYPIVSGKHPK